MRSHSTLRSALVATVAALCAAASAPDADRDAARSNAEQPTPGLVVTESGSSVIARLHLGTVDVRERFNGPAHHHEVYFRHSERLGIAEAPDLPVVRRWFAVPECAQIDIRSRVHSERRVRNVVLRQPPRSELGVSEFPDASAKWHRGDNWYPSRWARVLKMCHLRGQNMALIEFSPVRYSAPQRELLIADDLEIELRPVGSSGGIHTDAGPMQALVGLLAANSLGRTHGLPGTYGRVQMSSETGAYKWCMSATESDWQATADSVKAFGADYVILVADELVAHAEDRTRIEALASHRASTNLFNVAIVPMQGIDASPDTFQTPITIRDFIKTVYESGTASHMADGKLAYVLLLGDAFNPNRAVLIPGYYGFPIANFDLQGFLQSSDAYYSLLSEDPVIDDLPEVFLGRLPVDHDDEHWELGNVVNNILDYEPLPFAAWTDRILMVSGGSTVSFTFDGEGGAGFENFFDSIDAYYIPANKSVTKMHRLTSGLGNTQFSKAVADSAKNGFGLLAMFDHGNYFELAGAGGGGCVLPAHYDTLNVQRHPVVLAIGSYLGTFDYTRDKASLPNATCCTSSDPGATCLQVPVTSLDPCDVLTERMVLQPGGAIGAFGYCRSQNAPFVNRPGFSGDSVS